MSEHELVLAGGTILDGTGGPPRELDVGVTRGRITELAQGLRGMRTVDCKGLVVCPGFLDTHSHSDLKLLVEPDLPMKLRQGITLEVLGQDGISVAPVRPERIDDTRRSLAGLDGDPGREVWRWEDVAGYLGAIEATRPALSFGYLVPHGTLRAYVMGPEDRRPTGAELEAMRAALEQGLRQGALGLSTGLIYPPCMYAGMEELVALGGVLARARAPLVVHMRSESDHILAGVDEMLEVGRRSGCAIHLSHFKVAGRQNFPRAAEVVARVEAARAAGQLVTADQYPYAAGSTMFAAILPPWAHDGGPAETLRRLASPEERGRLRAELSRTEPLPWDSFWKWTGPEGIVLSDVPSGRRPEVMGKNVAEAAAAAGKEPLEFALELLLSEELGVGMISHSQSEEVMASFARLPWVNGCTDGLLGGRPHPRAYGAFPRFLGELTRERKLVPLPEMIRKLTSQAAKALGIAGVGEVRVGYRADLCCFDPARVRDTATFARPISFPEGIPHVVVGGQLAVHEGEATGARGGVVVRKEVSL